jgi:hypothetical protein
VGAAGFDRARDRAASVLNRSRIIVNTAKVLRRGGYFPEAARQLHVGTTSSHR